MIYIFNFIMPTESWTSAEPGIWHNQIQYIKQSGHYTAASTVALQYIIFYNGLL